MIKNDIYTLEKVPFNKKCIVSSLNCREELNKRLTDLGMGRGSVVIPVHKSPFGDIISFFVGGSVIAVRKEDCKNICVEAENF